MVKFQNYKHYKLPITINPLEYGKLVYQNINFYVLCFNKTNLALINQHDLYNQVKFFREGSFIFEYNDHIIDDNSFIRSLENNKFTFKNGELISNEFKKIIRILVITSCIIMIYFFISPEYYLSIVGLSVKNKLNWYDYIFEIKNTNFSSKLFNSNLNKFWNEVIENKLSDNQHIWLLFRLQWTNNNYVTIGKLVKLNKEDKDYLFNYILKHMEDKSEYYTEQLIKSMVFSYTIKKGRAKDKITFDSSNLSYQYFHHHKLPITMNPLEYGKLIEQFENKYTIQVNKTDIALITQDALFNLVKFYKEGDLIYEYKDYKLSHNSFIRSLGNRKFTFIDNKLVLLSIDKSVKFIKNLLAQSKLTNKIITMDIETYIKDGVHVPYTISWTDGEKSKSYFILDSNSSNNMLTQAIKDIMIKKYDNFNVYIHNLSRFDGIFLLKILVNLGKIKPLIHHGDLISIGFKFKNYIITFKDSQQLLILSLRKLGKAFGVETQKGYFPYSFVNENNLNYIGITPDFSLFNNISHDEYDGITSYNWNLRDEAIKYCEIDCISLYQIIFKFSELIFGLFKINIHKYPTLSSLAFAIFKTHFLREDELPQLSGQIANDIREGYTGGAVDVYVPQNKEGTKIYCYDVNSLYPYVMNEFDMPVGKPIYFEGDIRAIDKDAFGFFYCKIVTPNNLKHPIIQTHVKSNNGLRTVAALGSWESMIFSEEMDNAMKFGYQFEILWGYKFDKGEIFKDYVDFLYNIRLQYPKSHPLNYIAKILLNSLYGRFGMDDNFQNINIIHKDYLADFENKFFDQIEEKMDLGDHVLLFHKKLDSTKEDNTTHNVSIAVASSITAYSRIHMSQFKNNPSINLYYTDTDSIYTDSDLDESFIDNKVLGKLKLENIGSKAIFLAPKVYCLLTKDGEFIHKVKGLNHEIDLTFKDFENLLNKDLKIEKTQVKWKRSLNEGKINILEQLYTLKVTENKRKLIYKNSKLVGTKAYKIASDKTILK
jgi:hypothetical protein